MKKNPYTYHSTLSNAGINKGFLLFFIGLAFALSAYVFSSCTPEEERVNPNPSSGISFSRDTVYFDTILTNIGSITERFRIYNNNDEAIEFESIGLANNVGFEVIINGKKGNASNLRLLGRDSLMVLVSIKINPNSESLPFVVEDSLVCSIKGRVQMPQRVLLRAYGQNANFFRSAEVCTQTWADTLRPYVIIDDVVVPEGCTLTIKEGVEIMALPNTFFIVAGTLITEGSVAHPVVFGGYRREERFRNQSNQWGQLVFLSSSRGNKLNHTIVENSFRGIQLGLPEDAPQTRPQMQLSNSIIRNCSDVGLMAFNANLLAYNNIIIDCASNLMAILNGGTYQFYHNTATYSGNVSFTNRNPGTLFADNFRGNNGPTNYPLQLVAINNGFLGNQNEELQFAEANAANNSIRLENNLIRTNSTTRFNGNFFTRNNFGLFRAPLRYDFRPDSSGPLVRNRAVLLPNLNLTPSLNIDLRGNLRFPSDSVSLGAIQFIKNEK